jgi:hypothetical protein
MIFGGTAKNFCGTGTAKNFFEELQNLSCFRQKASFS